MADLHIPAEHLRAILDAVPEGIGVECNGQIVWANRGFARLYGYRDAAEIAGWPLDRFVDPDDLERLADYSRQRLAGEDIPDHYRFRGMRKDGSTVEIEIFVSSYLHNGRLHVLGALRDITERESMARRMEQAQKLEALGTLTRGIAHDFNNLLTAVMGNIALAREQLTQGQDPEPALRRAATAADKGAQLTRQLQAFSGRQHGVTETVEPGRLVSDTIELLTHSIGPDLRFEVTIAPDLPAAALPPEQLQQVLMNLALNAVDAMPQGGVLALVAASHPADEPPPFPAARPGAYLRFEVHDTGEGIDPSVLPRIYEPFFTTKPVGKGTGLGLAVVFGTVRTHNGWLEVSSEPGQGTCFTVWLPASSHEPAKAKPTARQPLPRSDRGYTVLVVDDDPQVRAIFGEILALGGYEVLITDSGEAAVAEIDACLDRGCGIDLALVDLVMPGMDGVDCLWQLRNRAPGLPVLLCTGLDRDGRLDNLVQEPGLRVMRKPLSIDDLLAAVRDILQAD